MPWQIQLLPLNQEWLHCTLRHTSVRRRSQGSFSNTSRPTPQHHRFRWIVFSAIFCDFNLAANAPRECPHCWALRWIWLVLLTVLQKKLFALTDLKSYDFWSPTPISRFLSLRSYGSSPCLILRQWKCCQGNIEPGSRPAIAIKIYQIKKSAANQC